MFGRNKLKKIQVYEVSLNIVGTLFVKHDRVISPAVAGEVFIEYLGGADREYLVVLCLDAQERIIGINTVCIGVLSNCPFHPREIYKPAILCNAFAIIIGHNHPSQSTEPSQNDIEITRQIYLAGSILGIPLQDHIIVDTINKQYSSLKLKGIF